MSDSIHDLFRKVQEHPDYAGGAIFVREDVATGLHPWEDPTPELVASITDEQLEQAKTTINSYIFNGTYTWATAIFENVEPTPEQRAMFPPEYAA